MQQQALSDPNTENMPAETPVRPMQQEPTRSDSSQTISPRSGRPGYIGNLVGAINRPWLLLTVSALLGFYWLIQYSEIIPGNLATPYIIAGGTAVIVGVALAGWFIVQFFRMIEHGLRQAIQAFIREQQEDSVGQFFWLTVYVLMIVSVLESGQFFDMIVPHVVPGLGYAVAFVVDMVAVNALRARLEAARMHDTGKAWLYLFVVAVCAGASGFANLYIGLSDFHRSPTGVLPIWMHSLAPWFALLFPSMMLLMSLIADYVVDRTSTKLDAQKYRDQEQKRLDVLEVRREMQEKLLMLEEELTRLSRKRRTISHAHPEREIFLLHWFFPRKPVSLEQSIERVTGQLQTVYEPQFAALTQRQQVIQQQFTEYVYSLTQAQQRNEHLLHVMRQEIKEHHQTLALVSQSTTVAVQEERQGSSFTRDESIVEGTTTQPVAEDDPVRPIVETPPIGEVIDTTNAAQDSVEVTSVEDNEKSVEPALEVLPVTPLPQETDQIERDWFLADDDMLEITAKTEASTGQQEATGTRSPRIYDDPAILSIQIVYPAVTQWLTKGVKSLTVEEIVAGTDHSRRMVLNRVKDGTIKKTKNPDRYRIESVLEWLKSAPLPRRQETGRKEAPRGKDTLPPVETEDWAKLQEQMRNGNDSEMAVPSSENAEPRTEEILQII